MAHLQEQQDIGYSAQAEHFHNTRKKRWPEVEHIIASMNEWRARKLSWWKQNKKDRFSLADLGCGSWRLAPLLAEKSPGMNYHGVDSAAWMVEVASKEFPDFLFEQGMMTDWLTHQKQESLDCVVALASMQHIQGAHNHALFLHTLYRSLERWGRAYLVNRSFSNRFLKNYWRNVWAAVARSVWRSWRAWNDLVIPWKDKAFQHNGKQFDRLYHMFTLYELRNLCEKAGFVVKECCFVGQDGEKVDSWRASRNSFVVVEKGV